MFTARIQSKRFITVGGTLFCAWGVGYLMQSSAQEALPMESRELTPQIETGSAELDDAQPLKISGIKLTSAILAPVAPQPLPAPLPDTPVVMTAPANDQPVADLPEEVEAPSFACVHRLSAEPAAAAMVSLTINAPCMVKHRFTVHHNGMMFSDVTDENGLSNLTVPALARDAAFIVSFANGEGAFAQTTVTALENYDRAVVQWSGDKGVQLHALEFGASYHENGHVWAGDLRDVSTAALGQGGFITRLGADDIHDARIAEVYTFPSGTSVYDGAVHLSVEAEVTEANCGRDVEAQSIQLDGSGQLKVQDVVLAMPACDAIGDFLVLKNLLNDLKIARN